MTKNIKTARLLLLSCCFWQGLWAQKKAPADSIFAGYAQTISGETIGYTSYTPLATTALLTRTNTGKMAIAWQTVAVPAGYKRDFIYFRWIGGNNVGTATGSAPFDLYIGDQKMLTIRTSKDARSPGWHFTNSDGLAITFTPKATDKNGDVSGEVILKVPQALYTPGRPLSLKITGQQKDNNDWLMVYEHSFGNHFRETALPLLRKGRRGDTLRVVRITGEYDGNQGLLHIANLHTGRRSSFTVVKGYNEFQMAVPYRAGNRAFIFQSALDDAVPSTDTLLLSALPPMELHLIHHSHTDIGYSDLQQKVAAIHNHDISEAIRLIEATKDYPPAAQFRYNVESLWAVENFLDSAGEAQVQAFARALHTGRLSLSATYANELTGIMRGEALLHLTDYARYLEKRFDIRINSAMITDVPGYTASFIKALQMAGVKYFSIGPNNGDRIGYVLSTWGDRPFYWKEPGGDGKLLAYVSGTSYSYFHGTNGAIEPNLIRKRITDYVDKVIAEKYPYRYVAMRYNIVADNAPLDTAISGFVKKWNEQYIYPKLVLSTPAMVLGKIGQDYGGSLPVYSGDMTPYWEDGAASTAAELARNEEVSDRLQQTEILYTMLAPERYKADDFYKAWRGVVMFDEHTWGAWCSISDPDTPFTTEQWDFKKQFVIQADSLEQALRSGLLKPFERHTNDYQAINTLSWPHDALLTLDDDRKNRNITDAARRPLPQQSLPNGKKLVYIKNIPALDAVTLYSQTAPQEERPDKGAIVTDSSVENKWVRIGFDKKTGAIRSFFLKQKNAELVKPGSYGLNQYLYVPGRNPETAETATLLQFKELANGPLCTLVEADCSAPGSNSLVSTYQLNNLDGTLTITNTVDKKKVRTKESVHFAFPFHIPQGRVMADNGYMAYDPFTDTLPGANKDFSYVGKWVDISNPSWGVTVCTPQAPIAEWTQMVDEEIAPGKSAKTWKRQITPSQTFFSYVMNNYWHTNYKADQEGKVSFTYTIIPHDQSNPADAYKRAEEVTEAPVVIPTDRQLSRPPFVTLDNEQVVISAARPAGHEKGICFHLYNPTGKAQTARLKPATGKLWLSNLDQQALKALPDTVELAPYETICILQK